MIIIIISLRILWGVVRCGVVRGAVEEKKAHGSAAFPPVQKCFHRIYDQNLVLGGLSAPIGSRISLEMSEQNETI